MPDTITAILSALRTARRPRPHHYGFAHRALAAAALQSPSLLHELLTNDKGVAFLHGLWHDLGQSLRPPDRLRSVGLCLHRFAVGAQGVVFVVRLPSPLAATEAHMTATLLPRRPPGPYTDSSCAVRYFTLEKGISSTGESTTLGEWRLHHAGLTHCNHGSGPLPMAADLAAAVCAHAGLPRPHPVG